MEADRTSVVEILISYLLCLHPGTYSFTRASMGAEKLPASACLVHQDLPSEEKQHSRSVNLGKQNMSRAADLFLS